MARVLLALAVSYILGGFLGGALAAKLKGIDLRRHGSGSMGATNVLRTMGPFLAVVTLLIDVAKGLGAVAVGRWTGVPGLDAVCGTLVIAGHNWPISASFRGGKGIATTLGTMILLAPKAPPILVPLWVLLVLPTRIVSLGSIAASVTFPVLVAIFYHGQAGFAWVMTYAVLAALMAVYQHRENIARLRRGTENRLWGRKKEIS